jgi:cyclic beta-1,2-glucan synthetase
MSELKPFCPSHKTTLKNTARALMAACFMALLGTALSAANKNVNLKQATGRGVFNIGPSKGTLVTVPDDSTRQGVLKLVYEAPSGSMVGVWTKGYPVDLGATTANAVKISVNCEKPEQAREVSVAVEVKGDKEVQRIVVPLQGGWSTLETALDWDRVGKLKEVVFVVAPVGGARKGNLLFDLQFTKTALVPKKVSGIIGVTEAGARGIFNIKTAEGMVNPIIDSGLKKEVLKLDYSATPGSFVGIWTKGYPKELNAKNFNGLKVAVKGSALQAKQLAMVLEIKGSKDVQRIPLPMQTTWAYLPHLIDWSLVGDLREVVFVLSPVGGARKGSVFLDLSFVKLAQSKPSVAGAFGLNDAKERGVFNMGPAQLTLGTAYDGKVGKEVTSLSISAPAKSIVGVWSKNYPAELLATSVNGVMASIRVPKSSLGQFTAALEIKGTGKDIQRVPFVLEAGWNTLREPLDWKTIGQLREAVFVIVPDPKLKQLDTNVAFDLEFSKGDFPKRLLVAPPSTPVATNGTAPVVPTGTTFSIAQAAGMGVFNIKDSEGLIDRAVDSVTKKEVLKFDYRCPTGTVVGIWSKDYPADLTRAAANGVRIAVNLPNAAQAGEITLSLELKGEKVQVIPLTLQPGWTTIWEPIRWSTIESLKEAVFVLTPVAGGERKGTIYLDLEFFQGTFPVKDTGPSGAKKTLWVFVGGLISALLVGGLGKLRKKDKSLGALLAADKTISPVSKVSMDLLTGVGAVLTVGTSLAIYALGTVPLRQSPVIGLGIGTLGVVIAWVFKWTRTKTHLTGIEAFQNFFVTGLLWATASQQVLWQAPTTWTNVLLKSHLTSALVCLIYHGANGVRLSTVGKHLRPIAGGLMVGIPFLFGGLLVLESPELLQTLGAAFFGGAGLRAAHEIFGRFLILFAFNEIVANAIGFATKGVTLRSWKAHGWIALMTVAVVVSPYIADGGSSAAILSLPKGLNILVVLLSAMLSQAGLWMEAYLITGMILDGMYGYAPNESALARHGATGLKKGMAYSAIFLGLLFGIKALAQWPATHTFILASPVLSGVLFGALVFPLIKTIIESFDGSMPFLLRARYSYRQWTLYLRGAVVGGGFAYGMMSGVRDHETGDRLFYGLLVGLLASGGVSLLRDLLNGLRRKGHIQTLRVYFIDSLIGGFIGALIAFYLDSVQVTAIVQKFAAYTSYGQGKTDYTIYSLLSKWGRINLGSYTGGVKLFFDEALAGLITWSIAAPLFAINRVFMTAYFQRDKAPIRYFFSKAGAAELMVNLIHVMRWGLWMSPIINTGIRMMGHATWYNQDGALRTLVAIFKNVTLSPGDFQAWSLGVFVSLLAFDFMRVLIWLDHMGLRVATLVNLSFIGMDKLDEKIARFIGPSAAQRYLPEGVKRFTTWAPLLIPFYIPRGLDWDFAWTKSEEMQKAAANAVGLSERLLALNLSQILMYAGGGRAVGGIALRGLQSPLFTGGETEAGRP